MATLALLLHYVRPARSRKLEKWPIAERGHEDGDLPDKPMGNEADGCPREEHSGVLPNLMILDTCQRPHS